MDHNQRVKAELVKAGFSAYSLLKQESRNLAQIINTDEHIIAAVIGRGESGTALLAATDKRIIYFDKKPFFAIMDQINYDILGGVSFDQQAGFAHVTLKSRAGDYMIRYANPACAEKFVRHLEKVSIDNTKQATSANENSTESKKPKSDLPELKDVKISKEATAFIKTHELGIISTVDRNNLPHSAVVYYVATEDGLIRFLTKSGTQKSRDIVNHNVAAFVIYDEEKLQTVQLQAYAEIESDQIMRQFVYSTISRERSYKGKMKKPPVSEMKDGSFTVIKLTPTNVKFTDFNKKAAS